jgi:UDP-N-acetylmuramyl pentapeptide phosphotransferase/UDP-N-acetylglucosamine-1-phosphate transferase
MQILATFEHTVFLEMALAQLKERGISDLFALPLDNRTEERRLFDSLHHSDGASLMGKGMVLAALLSVVGASRGFELKWGPVYWGLIGAGSGFVLGFLIDLFIHKVIKKKKRLLKGKRSEVVLIINCEGTEASWIEKVLWDHLALGLAKIE